MAITASGLYGLTLEKIFIDTAGQSIEAETHNVALLTNANTPDFDAHNFRDDVTETSGTGYSAGGDNLTSTEFTLSGGTAKFDAADSAWTSSTITARAALGFFDIGAAATDMLIWLSNFGADASTVSGTFTVVYSASGIWTLDYTPA